MDVEKDKLNDSQNSDKNSDKNINQKFITDVEEIIDPEKKRIRLEEEKEALKRAKKRKLIPPFVMLSAGAIISIAMFVMRYKTKDMLVILLCVLVVFYIAGELIKWMFDRFEAQIEEARLEEGEVIEKEPDVAVADKDKSEKVTAQNEKKEESA
ncbi:MAG: hypothetical protein K2N85_04110 [Lachnospiraceae bacterium]|nr:hypothetical protein [Lachnospiraceae bacterium]